MARLMPSIKNTMTNREVYAGAALLGAIAGSRSFSAPALVSRAANSGLLPVSSRPLRFLAGPKTAKTIAFLAVGEFIADKLPFVPNRTASGPLIARALSGGLSGAAFASGRKRSRLVGALLGAAGAIGASYGFYELRRRAGKRFGIPDSLVAVAEDAFVAGAGLLIASRLRVPAVV
jgi:uncharacterized membrane protein